MAAPCCNRKARAGSISLVMMPSRMASITASFSSPTAREGFSPKVSIAGVCKARLNVTGSLEGDAVGASEVAYSGKPARVDVDATGPSTIKHL